MNYTKYTIFSMLFLVGVLVKAQQDLTLMNLTNIQQIQYVNPAFRPQARLNIGIPGASSLYFNHYNTVFTPKDLFEVNGSTTTLRVEHLKQMWKNRNDLSFSAKADILHFGFLFKKQYYVSFNITENAFARLTLPGDLLRFPLTGNANFAYNNGKEDFSNFGLELNHYREYALGLQREFGEKWSFGAKLKYLYGMENIHTKKSDIKLETDPQTYDWTISGEYDVNTSGIASLVDSIDGNNELENNEIMKYATKRKNRGLGIDFGATYKINEKLTVAGSVVDLGFIRWKNDVKNIATDKGEYVFRGLDFTNVLLAPDSLRSDSIDALVTRTQDDFKNSFNASSNTKAYTTSLMTRFYLSGSYGLYEVGKFKGRVSALFHGELFQGRLRPSYSIAYTQDLGRILQLTASYSITHRDYRNIGIGASLNLGSFQIYMVTDNILVANLAEMKTGANSSFKYPYSAKNMHIRAGINLTFGRKNKDKDGDGIKDKKDNCPEVAGLPEFKGCPDTDKDSIPDPVDECPTVAGIPAFKGCPDTDGDGIKDSEDKCPQEKGKKETGGCPDKDADGIIDAEDKCPDVFGIKAFEGCPDTDEDGVPDSEDKCPTEVGSKDMEGCPDTDADGLPDHIDACPMEAGDMENNGCPWGDRDNDGVKDNKDKCPNVPGLIENQGCPEEDSDSDGVPNKTDKCPNTPGPKSNQGCPELKKEEKEVLNTAFDNLEFQTGRPSLKMSRIHLFKL